METANFQCGHCGNLMGVGTEFLGQQVRCPHCQQVVVAPAPPAAEAREQTASDSAPGAALPPAPAPLLGETTLYTGPDQEPESIFTPPTDTEDLFGGTPSPPRLEVPDAPSPAPAPALAPTLTSLSPDAAAPAPAPEASAALSAVTADGGPVGAADLADAIPRPVRRPSRGGGWFIALVFIPLVSYAILATIAVAILYNRTQTPRENFFEKLPDVDGDNPGVRKVGRQTWKPTWQQITAPLPDSLKVRLGETLTVGALEVKPLRVERKKIRVYVEGYPNDPQECLHDSLVLYLSLRNVSTDLSFTPLDNYLDRHWKRGDPSPPLTQLEVGSENRFVGGPANWFPRFR
jgi:hypothetical protein